MVVGLANHTILVRKDGTEVPIDDSGAPIRDGDGKTVGVVLVFRDITERKRAEETLRESEEKYRNLVKYAPAGIYEIDIQGTKFFSINDVMCNILGYSREELLLMRPADLLDQEGISLFQERIRKQLAGETVPATIEYRVRKKNGEWIDAAINTGVCAYLDGKPTRISVIGYDITERKQIEKELRESEARLRRFYQSGLIGVIYWNMAGVIIDANDKFLEIVGYTREDLTAGKMDWVEYDTGGISAPGRIFDDGAQDHRR